MNEKESTNESESVRTLVPNCHINSLTQPESFVKSRIVVSSFVALYCREKVVYGLACRKGQFCSDKSHVVAMYSIVECRRVALSRN